MPDTMHADRQPDRTWATRLLSPIAEVKPTEVRTVLLLAAVMFLILGAYYMLKTAREVFILSEGGAAVKSYSSAGQAILLLFLVPAYGAFASRVNRDQLVQWVTLFFVVHVAFFVMALGSGAHIGIAYFLWVGIFNLMVIAQFWAFATDLLTREQGKRLFPLIGVGASLGAWVGSVRAGQLMEAFGPRRLMVGAAVALVVAVVLARLVSRSASRPAPGATPAAPDQPIGGPSGFALIFSDRYLMLIAALAVLLNVANTTGEYLFGRYVVEAATAAHPADAEARQQFIGAAYSRLFSTVNLLGFLLQMFVVSRVFKWLGVGKALYIHPFIALVGYLLMLRAPSMAVMGWFKVADNSVDYSLGNTTKQALWLPTSRAAKYKAKQAVDSFFVRAGDVLQGALVFVGERLAFAVPAFAAVNIVLVCGWLGVTVLLNRELSKQDSPEEKPSGAVAVG
jgi:ATP:ADP antiporter, AAA family